MEYKDLLFLIQNFKRLYSTSFFTLKFDFFNNSTSFDLLTKKKILDY